MEYVIIILISAATAGMVSLMMSMIAYFFIKKAITEEIDSKLSQFTSNEAPKEKAIATEDNTDYIDSSALFAAEPESTIKKNINEDEDESDILTGSDLSKHMPKTKEFEELNIPTLEEISVAELDSNDASSTNVPAPISEPEPLLADIPNDLTDDQNDDEATVLMHRKPPE